MRVKCTECASEHDLNEMSLVAPAPAYWASLGEADRERSELTPDQCVIRTDQETAYFVAANLEIPVKGIAGSYSWGVWVSLSEASFNAMHEHWHDPARVELGPYFGWLCTELPGYPRTMLLKTMVHQRPVGLRPTIELEPTEHPLAVHQRDGIDQPRLLAILHEALDTEQ